MIKFSLYANYRTYLSIFLLMNDLSFALAYLIFFQIQTPILKQNMEFQSQDFFLLNLLVKSNFLNFYQYPS